MQAEFNASNSYRCAQAEMPFCACDNPASPPPAGHAPPPPFVYTEEWHAQPSYVDGERPVRGGGVTDVATPWTADEGQVSALTKRLVNGRTISLSASCTPIEPHSYTSHTHARRATVACAWQIRSSHRVVDCPGDDDAEPTCARVCAQEHLGFLRAFAVTGARHTPPPPSLPPPRPAPPAAPLPPHAPFSECLNTCDDKLAVGDAKCREGAKGAYLPTLCEYSTNCRNCGFRENTDAIESDDSCAHANDGVCQDGGTGSSFQAETTFGYGGLTHLCGLGTAQLVEFVTFAAEYNASQMEKISLAREAVVLADAKRRFDERRKNGEDVRDPPLLREGWGEITRLCAITDMKGCTFGSVMIPTLIPAVVQAVQMFLNYYPFIVGKLHIVNCQPTIAAIFRRALTSVVPAHVARQITIHALLSLIHI